VQGLDALLIERSPDFLVILDAELRVVKASAGLRSSVPIVAPARASFAPSTNLRRSACGRRSPCTQDGTFSLSLELVHRAARG